MKGSLPAVRDAAIAALLTVSCFVHADEQYREPRSILGLPPSIADILEEEKCRVPVASEAPESTNAISGTLANEHQTDWAVQCVNAESRYIRVFWGGPAVCETRIQIEAHSEQATAEAYKGAVRIIKIAGATAIQEHYAAYGGSKPPELNHVGIDFIYVGKASTVFYCHEGKWLELGGAD